MKDPESAESIEKSNFRSLQFLFFELWSFLYSKWPQFRWIFTHNSKNKNRNKMYFVFHSIQHISYLALSQLRICRPLPLPPPSEVVRFLWKMRNVLNRMKNYIIFFLRFSFFELWVKIHRKLGSFWVQKMTRTRKIKLEKTGYLVFLSIQAILDLSC